MSFQKVAELSDLDDQPFPVITEDEAGNDVELALVKFGEEIFAIYDICSHQHVNLSEGDVDEECTIECWLHGSRFDLRTGKPLNLPATQPVPVYPVKIEGDSVAVDIANPIQEK